MEGRPKQSQPLNSPPRYSLGLQPRGMISLSPMPGHPLSPATEPGVKAAYDKLEQLIKEHQIIFLLMDSRESRWLPTVMAATYPVGTFLKILESQSRFYDNFLSQYFHSITRLVYFRTNL